MNYPTSWLEAAPILDSDTKEVLRRDNYFLVAGAMALQQTEETAAEFRTRSKRIVQDIDGIEQTLDRYDDRLVFRDEHIVNWITIWARAPKVASHQSKNS